MAPYFTEAGWRPSTSAVPYFEGALVFMTLVYLFETYLDYRQYRKLQETAFPQPLETAIRDLGKYKNPKESDDGATESESDSPTLLTTIQAKFDTSRAYGLDKSKFGFVSGVYTQLESTVFLLLGYLPFMWTLSGRTLVSLGGDPTNEITRTLTFLTFLTLRDTLVGLPFSLYSTFVVEARHGFNKQTLGLFCLDKVKTMALFFVLGYPITTVLIYVIRWGGTYFYVYVWAFLFVVSLLLVTLYPVLIMPLFNKFTPLEPGPLRTRIEALATRVQFPLAHLFVTDGSTRSSHSNAYFFGLFQNKRIVLFDTLLDQATDDEIVAILGHELGHWQRGHTLQGFVLQQAYILSSFYVFGHCMNDSELFVSFGFADSELKPVILAFLLFSQTIWAPIDHFLSFLMTLQTRKNEFEADAFAVELGYEDALKTGLTKLAIENLANMNPDALYSAYHYSHPPLVERLNAITACGKKAL